MTISFSKLTLLLLLLAGAAYLACAGFSTGGTAVENETAVDADPLATPAKTEITDSEFDGRKITRTPQEWRKLLSPDQFYILREEGTETAFSGALDKNKSKGSYHCAACGLVVFRSKAKYDSGTGWPSFYQPAYRKNVTEKVDRSLPTEERIEIECARCGSHLGHVFDDGPRPTGLRYCINSLALRFVPEKN